jgi:hypothetical protein
VNSARQSGGGSKAFDQFHQIDIFKRILERKEQKSRNKSQFTSSASAV